MHVELPRSDYLLAALVALVIVAAVGTLTIVPSVILLDGWRAFSSHFWARLITLVPIACGGLAAWHCLQRAKRDRMHDQLVDELRD